MKKYAPTIIKYAVTVAIGAVMSCLILSNYEYAKVTDVVRKYKILCDAFSVPGILIMMLGCLVYLSNEGALDGVSFLVGSLFKRLFPFGQWREERHESYSEYVERKRAKRVKGYGFVFVVGAGFLAVSLIFYILFYSVY